MDFARGFGLGCAFCIFAAPAHAACTYGDAKALFQSAPVFVQQFIRGQDTAMVEAWIDCEYLLFDSSTIHTYASDDFFVGKMLLAFPYTGFGVTRAEAIEDLELVEQHLWVIPANADWTYDATQAVEEDLLTTAYKDLETIIHGKLVYQTQAIIQQLAAGHYVSVWTYDYPGNPELAQRHPDDPFWVEFFSAYSEQQVVYLDVVP